jgi:hypothetical protein
VITIVGVGVSVGVGEGEGVKLAVGDGDGVGVEVSRISGDWVMAGLVGLGGEPDEIRSNARVTT